VLRFESFHLRGFFSELFSSHNLYLKGCIAAYTAVSLIFLPASSNILNPDGLEYANIARHYIDGNLTAAINGIWSPFLSVLLIIPRLLGIDSFVFFRILLIPLSWTILIATNVLFERLAQRPKITTNRYVLLFVTIFCLYATILTPVTPDLFSVLGMLLLINVASSYFVKPNLKHAILLGLIVGAGYYAKNYFLYFGIAFIAAFYSVHILVRGDLKQSFKHSSACLLTIFCVVAPWIALMSIKANHLTLNPIGNYSISQAGPNYPGAPVKTLGLLDPPYYDSITAREDPSTVHYISWSPLDSRQDLKYYLQKVIPHNIVNATKLMAPALFVLTIAVTLVLVNQRKKLLRLQDGALVLLLFGGLLYILGYLLIHLEGGFRYLWPTYVLWSIASVYLLGGVVVKYKHVVLLAAVLLLSIYPIRDQLSAYPSRVDEGRIARHLANQLEQNVHIKPGDRIASNDPYAAANLCFFLTLRCYGLPHSRNVDSQLKEKSISYYLHFSDGPDLAVQGITIYSTDDLEIIAPQD
jgi:hypothetical protein